VDSKIQMPEGQGRITLPKRWLEDQNLQDKDELEVETMKREKGLKITIPKDDEEN
jgi:bifunctional DNA-binding transcriptional regulator/antitoxin component of YhaV-PrlF toxin-antitoxin module